MPGRHGGGRGRGHGWRKGRQYGGRPRVIPRINIPWQVREGEFILELTSSEMEALRLVDNEDLTQEQAAQLMNISRGTFWRILSSAKKKVAEALNSGKKIVIMILDQEIPSK